MNYQTLDHLFNADYRNLNWVHETARFYEVKKDGTIVYHESLDWNTVPTRISINQ